jgi:hypothetical protein
MFQQVVPHMDDPENCMPVISSIRLEIRDGWLYVVASDRYTLAATRRPIVHDGASQTAHIPGSVVPAVSAWLDGAEQRSETVALSLPLDGESGPVAFDAPGCGELTVEYEADDFKSYPNWRRILNYALTAEPEAIPVTGFTTRFLSRWEDAAAKLVVWQQAHRKPLVLLSEDGYFVGMQMPISYELKREDVAPGWIAATQPQATVDGVTYDLDLTWADQHGDPWRYSGKESWNGLPLMVIEGIEDDPYPLDRLIEQYGPLHAVQL